jgi:hypothetical protein
MLWLIIGILICGAHVVINAVGCRSMTRSAQDAALTQRLAEGWD